MDEASDCHKEAVQSIVVRPQTTMDISEQLSKVHARDMQLLLKILQICSFLLLRGININVIVTLHNY